MLFASWSRWWQRRQHRAADRRQSAARRRQRAFPRVLLLEELESRRLLSAGDSLATAMSLTPSNNFGPIGGAITFSPMKSALLTPTGDSMATAIPITLSNNPAPVGGVISSSPTYYAVTITNPGRLTAEVAPTGGITRLSLLSSDGQVLMQSDGQSAGNPIDLIDTHVDGTTSGTTYYLEVQGLAGSSGSYALITGYSQASAPGQSLPTGVAPTSIATGDFDGDGKIDIAVSNFYTGNVSVYLGTGDGTFSLQQQYAAGQGVTAILAGDFTGDGKLDLATANYYSGTVSILAGNGDGTFGPDVEYWAGAGASDLAAGDFGNHHLDLAVADQNANRVSILLNKGDGTFGLPIQYAVAGNPGDIVAGDFSGNGKLDLATANGGSNSVSILMGNGDGTFKLGQTIAVGKDPWTIVAGDFTGDGKLDLATSNNGSNSVSILLGNGDGTFTQGATLATGGSPQGLVAADFNDDGRIDLAAANFRDGTLSVFLNRGNGTFDAQSSIVAGSTPEGLAAADFNGDGVVDLAYTDAANDTLGVLLGKGDDTFQTQPRKSPMGQLYAVANGDFTGNGITDLAVLNYTTNDVDILLGQGDGSFRFGGEYSVGDGAAAQYLAVGDLTGNGIMDLVVSDYLRNQIAVLMGNGDGTFQAPVFYATGTNPTGLVLTDLNGDGKLDVATADNGSNQVSVLFGDGAGHFSAPVNYAVGNGANGIAAADFSHDGHLDLAVTNYYDNSVSILHNNGDGTFAPQATLSTGLHPISVTATDLTGNGNIDLAVANTDDASVSVFLGNGRGGFSAPNTFATGYGPYEVLTGDFNHDGKMDLATVDLYQSTVTIFQGNGDGTFQQVQELPVGLYPAQGVVGDFAGNGTLDIAVCNADSGDVSVLLGNGDGTFQTPIQTPIAAGPVSIAAADFTGDGYLDLVTVNPTTNSIGIALGNGDGTFQTPVNIPISGEPVAVTTGDFNGDGRPDIAVANYLGDTVSLLFGNGDGTFESPVSYTVGSHPDALVSGDFNGDGITDLAVANYASGTVSILLGRRDGTFQSAGQVAVGKGPVALAVGDVNRNGKNDVIVANSLSRTVSIIEDSSKSGFHVINTLSIGAAPSAVEVGDFTGNGKLDIVTADPAQNAVSEFLGNGDGTFQAPVQYAAGANPVALTAGHFDNDGRLDLAVANSNGNNVTVLLSQSNGAFQSQTPFAVGSYPRGIVAGDFTNDGRVDIATANALGQPISVGLGLGGGMFVDTQDGTYPIRSVPILADLTGDSHPDVAILSSNGQILVRFADPSAPGTFQPPVVLNPDPADAARDLTVLTINGREVVAALDTRDNRIAFYTYSGNSTFIRSNGPSLTAGMPVRIVAGDVNGDGRQDLVLASVRGDYGQIDVFLQEPSGTFGPASYEQEVGYSPSDLALVNLSGGPGSDIAVTDQYTGEVYVLLNSSTSPFSTQLAFRAGTGLYNVSADGPEQEVQSQEAPIALIAGAFSGSATTGLAVLNSGSDHFDLLADDGQGGVFNPVTSPQFRTGQDPISIVSGDFDGDGIADLAILDRASDQILLYRGDGHGGFVPMYGTGPDGQPIGLSAGNAPTGLTVGDVNGDGKLDLLVGNANGDVLTLLGKGDGTFQQYQRLDRGVALGLINVNGRQGFVYADQSRDQVTVQYAQAGQTFQQTRQDGILDPNAVALTDLTGNGIEDMIVANGGGNDVLVYMGLGNGQFGPARAFYTGTDPVSVTVADLTGDGIPDVIVANRGSNDVSVLFGSGQGSDWTLVNGPRLRAGIGPDSVAVADVYGNGIPDLLVANSLSNNLYLIRGVGGGFFDDAHPVIYHTGTDPEQVLVGHFSDSSQLDMVTLNTCSNSLSYFPGFGTAQTIALGTGPVAGVMGDFLDNGTDDLIVAGTNGSLSLVLSGSAGLQLASTMLPEGLNNVSDLVLGSTTDGTVNLYATEEGVDSAIPIQFALDLTPVTPSPINTLVPTIPSTVERQIVEFSSLSDDRLSVVPTLVANITTEIKEELSVIESENQNELPPVTFLVYASGWAGTELNWGDEAGEGWEDVVDDTQPEVKAEPPKAALRRNAFLSGDDNKAIELPPVDPHPIRSSGPEEPFLPPLDVLEAVPLDSPAKPETDAEDTVLPFEFGIEAELHVLRSQTMLWSEEASTFSGSASERAIREALPNFLPTADVPEASPSSGTVSRQCQSADRRSPGSVGDLRSTTRARAVDGAPTRCEQVADEWCENLPLEVPALDLSPEQLRALAFCLLGVISAYPYRDATRDDERTTCRSVE